MSCDKRNLLQQSVCRIMRADVARMACLRALQQLALPQGYIGAGFLRNAIWDHLSQKKTSTPLNDVDVIYFNADNTQRIQDTLYEKQLNNALPQVNWQVKNQARMHVLHGHSPYKNCEDAISYWIEKETCVAIALTNSDNAHSNASFEKERPYELAAPFEILAPFGLEANFAGTISINPKSPRPDVFNERVQNKRWSEIWPTLEVKP